MVPFLLGGVGLLVLVRLGLKAARWRKMHREFRGLFSDEAWALLQETRREMKGAAGGARGEAQALVEFLASEFPKDVLETESVREKANALRKRLDGAAELMLQRLTEVHQRLSAAQRVELGKWMAEKRWHAGRGHCGHGRRFAHST